MPEPPGVSETIPGTAIDARGATIAALREVLAAGAVTARGLTGFYLGRIERLDPLLHSVISVNGEALAEAQAIDEARAGGAAARPLEGIPVLIKDNIAVRGMPATAGSPRPREGRTG
jgi:amidase